MVARFIDVGVEVQTSDGFVGRIVKNEASFRLHETFRGGGAAVRVYTIESGETGEVRRYAESAIVPRVVDADPARGASLARFDQTNGVLGPDDIEQGDRRGASGTSSPPSRFGIPPTVSL